MTNRLRHIFQTLFPRPAAPAQYAPTPPPPAQPDVPNLPDPPALAGLHDIDWPSLYHAYGPAIDVPDQLRCLASPDKEIRENALNELLGNIWHQGTVYEASPYAVPFLIRLLTSPTLPDRLGTLGLLGALANGSSFHAVHYPKGRSSFIRRIPNYDAIRAREESNVDATRTAVAAGIDLYATFLADPDWRLRAAAVNLLAAFSDRTNVISPLLHRAADTEPHVVVRSAIWLCFARLSDSSGPTRDRLTHVVTHARDIRERYAAACAIVQLQGKDAPEDARHIVSEIARDEWLAESILYGLPWYGAGDVNCDTLASHPGIDASHLAKAPDGRATAEPIATYIDPLATADAVEAPGLAAALIFTAFPNAQPLTDRPWNDPQRQAIRAIVSNDTLWGTPLAMKFLYGRGVVPGRFDPFEVTTYRDALRRLLEQNDQR